MKKQREVLHELHEIHKEELSALPCKKRAAKLANLVYKYRNEHPEEARAWAAKYIDS